MTIGSVTTLVGKYRQMWLSRLANSSLSRENSTTGTNVSCVRVTFGVILHIQQNSLSSCKVPLGKMQRMGAGSGPRLPV